MSRRPDLLLRAGGRSVRVGRRAALVGLLLVVLLLGLALVGLVVGDYAITPGDALAAVLGVGTDPLGAWFVTELRAPRVVAAIGVGAALGMAGSLFQNVTGNPLGSPDIIGFTTGAATGALVQIILLGQSGNAVALGALAGGLATAGLVRLLVGRGQMTGQRLVLVGIGVGATLAAINSLLVVRASLESAQKAGFWLAGSLNAMLWPKVVMLLVCVLLLGAAAGVVSRPLALVTLGDDTARAVGVPVARVRGAAVLVGVALVSIATAVTGPVAFVALAAPQVARRLLGQPLPGVVGSGLTGAVIVLGSDLVAQHAFSGGELAVGVVTGALGGVYLIGLLALEWRKS